MMNSNLLLQAANKNRSSSTSSRSGSESSSSSSPDSISGSSLASVTINNSKINNSKIINTYKLHNFSIANEKLKGEANDMSFIMTNLQKALKNRSDTKFSEKNFTCYYNIGDLIVENGKLKICTNVDANGATCIGTNYIVSGESIYNVRED